MEAKTEQNRAQEWVKTLNSYPGFLEPVMGSCMLYGVISLYKIFQENPNWVNFPSFTNRLGSEGNIAEETLGTVPSTIDELAKPRGKLKAMSAQIIAHRDEVSFLTDVSSKDGVPAGEFESHDQHWGSPSESRVFGSHSYVLSHKFCEG